MPEGLTTAMRPEFAPDARSLFVIDDAGELWQYRLGRHPGRDHRPQARKLTGGFAPQILRATPLTNGDMVLCAPADASGGRLDGQIWLMPRPLGTKPPIPLGERCWEGIAVSDEHRSTTIAWTRSTYDFNDPDRDVLNAPSQILTGRIAYDRRGNPSLVGRTLLLDRNEVARPVALLEPQDFRTIPGRPGTDHELVFTTYGYQGGEVTSVDRATGRIVNHSRSRGYEEAEGIGPTGRWTTLERDPASEQGPSSIDIWRVALDGEAAWERLTYFTEFDGYGANQSVVSPDGRWMAFTLKAPDSEHGEGTALLLFDLRAWDAGGQGRPSVEPDRLPPYAPPQ
ncbi:hypothetical protein ACQP1W_18835 [Spirillospora sp. CA-255316]